MINKHRDKPLGEKSNRVSQCQVESVDILIRETEEYFPFIKVFNSGAMD